jgi:hypothetical protein
VTTPLGIPHPTACTPEAFANFPSWPTKKKTLTMVVTGSKKEEEIETETEQLMDVYDINNGDD